MLAMANILAMGGAHCNSMYVAAADRVGVERGQPFLGRSLIVSHTGLLLAGRISWLAREFQAGPSKYLRQTNARSSRIKHGVGDTVAPYNDLI
jgi:predicted amidohydrolase